MAIRKSSVFLQTAAGLALVVAAAYLTFSRTARSPAEFDGERAYRDVLTQMEFGPRTPASEAHARALAWMQAELERAGWHTEIQENEAMGHPIRNLLARRSDQPPQILLGAHYDSRLRADQEDGPAGSAPVPGANDGASGVAVLLELARSLPRDTVPLWLVFFDAEDNGGLPGWDWILGSRAFAAALTARPRAVIIVDMVGDANLNIYKELNSDAGLVEEIWAQAAALGYGQYFRPEGRYAMTDDHTPFLEAGIPAVDIIDFDYPYWHTSADTADKVSPRSLEAAGRTLWAWIVEQK